MTKIDSNKTNRDKATPFVAQPFEGQFFDGTFKSLDLGTLVNLTDLMAIVRCTTPYGTNLVEAHLNLTMTCSTALSVRVAIGYFDTDGFTAIETYEQADINQQHEFLTGSANLLASSGGTLFIDGLNIFPKIPKRGEANFSEDGFVVLLQFDRLRVSSDVLKKFEVICSSLMGLV